MLHQHTFILELGFTLVSISILLHTWLQDAVIEIVAQWHGDCIVEEKKKRFSFAFALKVTVKNLLV